MKRFPPLLLLVACISFPSFLAPTISTGATVILSPQGASQLESLAAREVRRYIYLRTGQLLPITTIAPTARIRGDSILVARGSWEGCAGLGPAGLTSELAALKPQQYRLVTIGSQKGRRLLVAGGDPLGTLYAAYRFAEKLGVRFYLHGDVVPDRQQTWELPTLDEKGAPLFALRGIQPFHDFPEGPDWWNREDYLAIIAQLPKLRMNFFGLHTYPEDRPNAEPTVWVGPAQEIGAKGEVLASYPSSYQSTLRGNWGYAPKKTSDYPGGSAALFERDDFGPEVMFGHIPTPATPEGCNEVFDRSAALLHDAFSLAHILGVKTCVGTETPLVVPKAVQQRLKSSGKNPSDLATVREIYEGIFRRAAQAYPLDYYWFWTPEGWTWSGTKWEDIMATTNDIGAALAAHKAVQAPFALATCGWVLGPQQDRAMFDKVLPKSVAVSCINREVGYTPVDAGFAEVKGRSKWAIPWMEDDPALTAPQFWVGRMRRDAADALRYGCDGLMGIHWRTRILSMNVGSLAQAAWDQSPWIKSYPGPLPQTPMPSSPGPVGGQIAAFPDNPIAGTSDAPLYQTVRYNLSSYRLAAPNGPCRVTLKFSEPHYDAEGKRVFDVSLQGQTVLTNLDIFARVGKNRALDFTYPDVRVTNGWLDISFTPKVEFPSLAAVSVEGPAFTNRVNCGGPAYKDYAADLQPAPAPKAPLPSTRDYYLDWASHEFGPDAGPGIAEVFEKMDGALPKPATWVDGPGGINPDPRPWEQVKKDYAFVDEFASFKTRVTGAGNVQRFEYWLNTLVYFRLMGEVNCAWGEYNRAMELVRKEKDTVAQRALALRTALPLRKQLVSLFDTLLQRLLAVVSNPGELGTLANWNQHNVPALLTRPGEELSKLLGEPLPPDAQPSNHYRGSTRLILPAARTCIARGESLKLKMLVLSESAPTRVNLYWRNLGEKHFKSTPFTHIARGVYSAALPPAQEKDLEYYAMAESPHGQPVLYPPTAPHLNQTVVVLDPIR